MMYCCVLAFHIFRSTFPIQHLALGCSVIALGILICDTDTRLGTNRSGEHVLIDATPPRVRLNISRIYDKFHGHTMFGNKKAHPIILLSKKGVRHPVSIVRHLWSTSGNVNNVFMTLYIISQIMSTTNAIRYNTPHLRGSQICLCGSRVFTKAVSVLRACD